jgi:hypothetical protein
MSSNTSASDPCALYAAANLGSLINIPQCAHAVRSTSICGGRSPFAAQATPAASIATTPIATLLVIFPPSVRLRRG